MKFVTDLPLSPPPPSGREGLQPKTVALLAELRANAGVWAEIKRYPGGPVGRNSASSRGGQFSRKHEGIQYATRTVGDEVVLYLRAVNL